MNPIFGINFGPQEIIVVLLIALLLFGAKRLPEIGKGMGKGIREFRDATKGLSDDVKAGIEGEEEPKKTRDDNSGANSSS